MFGVNRILAFQTIRIRLITYVGIILIGGFLTTNILSFQISKSTIRTSVLENELPLSSNTIYSEIQTDLLRPIFISSLMANDTFLRDWVLDGERMPGQVTRYLKSIRDKYDAFTSYFISAKTLQYYHFTGPTRMISKTSGDDDWFFHAATISDDYEVNIDDNEEQGGKVTIFINYRVLDYDGNFIGVAGVGLGLDSVTDTIRRYQENFRRTIYFIDQDGAIHLHSSQKADIGKNIREVEGLDALAPKIVSTSRGAYVYERNGETVLLTTRYLPELKWYLLVELNEFQATKELRKSFLANLGIGFIVIAVTLFLIIYTVNAFQSRLEEMASTDKLTGLGNRQTFEIVMKQALAQFARTSVPFSLILMDIDHFKNVNETYGHLAGDDVLKEIAHHIREQTRKSDILCRWGGEEFIILAPDCNEADAHRLAEMIRNSVMEKLSAGVAEIRKDENNETIIARADKALYAAKQQGRNRVGVAES